MRIKGLDMKKYIAPELKIANFKSEEIMLLSAILDAITFDGEADGIKCTKKFFKEECAFF